MGQDVTCNITFHKDDAQDQAADPETADSPDETGCRRRYAHNTGRCHLGFLGRQPAAREADDRLSKQLLRAPLSTNSTSCRRRRRFTVHGTAHEKTLPCVSEQFAATTDVPERRKSRAISAATAPGKPDGLRSPTARPVCAVCERGADDGAAPAGALFFRSPAASSRQAHTGRSLLIGPRGSRNALSHWPRLSAKGH